jgi:hypothetical protein
VGPGVFEQVLGSHLLPVGEDAPLSADDFEGFLTWREGRIAEEISRAAGTSIEGEGTTLPEPVDEVV